MLLYPVYALLFADAGLSTAEISSLFAIWSITGFVLEVPSGVWADAVSRRLLLTIAPLLSGAGYALWVLAPSYEAFAAGFVLWGAQGALQSGALEALVYEELERDGAADRYPRLMGRATALGTVAAGVATGLAAPVFSAGGFEAVGAASVLACLVAACVGASLPEHRRAAPMAGGADAAVGEEEPSGLRSFMAIVRDGARELRRSRTLRGAVLLVPAVVTVWGSLDEYLPLLATEAGATVTDVALLALVVYAGQAAGGLFADRVSRMRGRGVATVLAGAAALLAAGGLSGVPAGFAAIALAFTGFQAVTVVVDARLQAAIEGRARSTVTSLASLLTEVATITTFTLYAAGSAVMSHAVLFAAFAAAYLLVAPCAARVVDRVR
ncbi:MAG: MFS transporter [Solirubrobacteraceae bacterium]